MTASLEQTKNSVEEQYSLHPYPSFPIEEKVFDDTVFYPHSLVNAFYLRNRKVITTEGKRILDIGCGTGVKTLALALVNNGSHVTGVDISATVVNLASERAGYHKVNNVNFTVASIGELEALGETYDYINCDDTLYLCSDVSAALRDIKKVLAKDGILRGNLHSSLQRRPFLCAQKIFRMMGMFEGNPGEQEIQIVRDFMQGLDDGVVNKALTWSPRQAEDKFYYLMNYLLQSDAGYDVKELFSFLDNAGLSFFSMVNWPEWDVAGLFPEFEELPSQIKNFIGGLQGIDALRVYELLNPVHRLLDFWCGHKHEEQAYSEVDDWSNQDWYGANIHLQPQLKNTIVQQKFKDSIESGVPFEITLAFAVPRAPLFVDSSTAAWLFLLWDGSLRFEELVKRWQEFKPVNFLNSLPADKLSVEKKVIETLVALESLSYVLIEKSLIQF